MTPLAPAPSSGYPTPDVVREPHMVPAAAHLHGVDDGRDR